VLLKRTDPHGPSELFDVVDSRRLVRPAGGLVQVDDEQVAMLTLQLLAAGEKEQRQQTEESVRE
jgi:hypothetical protein